MGQYGQVIEERKAHLFGQLDQLIKVVFGDLDKHEIDKAFGNERFTDQWILKLEKMWIGFRRKKFLPRGHEIRMRES